MRAKIIRAGGAVALALGIVMVPNPAPASSIGGINGYIKVSGIPGEAVAALYEGWSELHDLRFGFERPADGSIPTRSSLRIFKQIDKASPLIYQALAGGATLPQVKIEMAREQEGRQLRWWRLVLQDVVISEARMEHNEADSSETLKLHFAKATVEYSLYDLSGRLSENHALFWDVLEETGGELPSPKLRAEGAVAGDGNLVLQWPGRVGATYRVLTSPRIEGPFQVFRTVEASEHGTLSETISLAAAAGFFLVEEVP